MAPKLKRCENVILITVNGIQSLFWSNSTQIISGKDIPVTQTLTIEEGAVPVHQKTKDQRLSHEQPVAAEDTSG